MNVKKIGKVILALALALALSVSMASCILGEVADGGKCTVVLAANGVTEEFEVRLEGLAEGKGALAALDKLAEMGKITYKATDSGYGAYLTEVIATNGSVSVKEEASIDKYVGIYTTVERDFDGTSYVTTLGYNGKTLTSSGVGISGMSLEDGCTVYITEIFY